VIDRVTANRSDRVGYEAGPTLSPPGVPVPSPDYWCGPAKFTNQVAIAQVAGASRPMGMSDRPPALGDAVVCKRCLLEQGALFQRKPR
jgi:hypothetical protein